MKAKFSLFFIYFNVVFFPLVAQNISLNEVAALVGKLERLPDVEQIQQLSKLIFAKHLTIKILKAHHLHSVFI